MRQGILDRKGLTLVEALVSISLLSAIVISILGAFFISRTSTERARHRMTAMNIVREYIEKEVSAGYGSGSYNSFGSDTPVTTVVGGITYSIGPEPYPAGIAAEGGVNYKSIGFVVSWTEAQYGGVGNGVNCSERAITYVSQH